MTSNRCEYLWTIENVSSESITSNFLTTQIEKIINSIGQDKIAGLVTDGTANCKMARRLIKEKYLRVITM